MAMIRLIHIIRRHLAMSSRSGRTSLNPKIHLVPTTIPHRSVDSPQDDAPQSEIVISKGQFALISKFDDYTLRGDDLAECCLYDYCSLFYKKKAQSGGFSLDDGHKR